MASSQVRVNEMIRAHQLRVIGPEGNQIGLLSREEALYEAEKHGLDLVEISPNATPPVARIVNWSKFNYQRSKEQQRNRRNAKSVEVKQMNLGVRIGENDLDIKCRKIRNFLEDGHKVKVALFFRGREMAHSELGYKMIDRIIQKLNDIAVADQPAQLAGKSLSILLRSSKSANKGKEE